MLNQLNVPKSKLYIIKEFVLGLKLNKTVPQNPLAPIGNPNIRRTQRSGVLQAPNLAKLTLLSKAILSINPIYSSHHLR